jgi:hypothetical protein
MTRTTASGSQVWVTISRQGSTGQTKVGEVSGMSSTREGLFLSSMLSPLQEEEEAPARNLLLEVDGGGCRPEKGEAGLVPDVGRAGSVEIATVEVVCV